MKIISSIIEAHLFRVQNGLIEFLLLKRSPDEYYPNLWQMVSGSIEENETAFKAALREIKEETNLTPIKIWAAPKVNSFYSPDFDYICLIPVFAAQVDFNSLIQISLEHTEYKWVTPDKAVKMLAWDGQRRSVELITDYFLNRNSFLNFIEITSADLKS